MIAVFLAQAALAQLATELTTCETQRRAGMDQTSYEVARTDREAAGFRLMREVVVDEAGRPRFAAVWMRDGGPTRVSRGAHGVDAFYFASLEMTAQDYRLVDLTVGVVAGSPYFSALWEKGRPFQQTVDYWLQETELRRKLKDRNQRVLAIAPYRIGAFTYYAAVFEIADGLSSSAAIGLTASALVRRDRRWRSLGYVLKRATPQPNRAGRLVAVWREPGDLSACERALGSGDPNAPTRR